MVIIKAIISASRRTDIPAFYWGWFKERIVEGYVELCNSYFPEKKYKVDLSKDKVHSIVLWSKDYSNLINDSSFLNDYNLCFQLVKQGFPFLNEL